MPADLEKYRHYVEGFDLSEAEKTELIHTVWAIMESFVDRAFGLDPVQNLSAGPACADSNLANDNVDLREETLTTSFVDSSGLAGGRRR